MSIHTLRIIKGGRTVARRQLVEGMGRGGAATVLAQEGALYLLGDTLNFSAPAKISVKRKGQDLHLSLGKGNPDFPDLIIEGYFDFPSAPIAGVQASGAQVNYDLNLSKLSVAPDGSLPLAKLQGDLPSEGWGIWGVAIGGLALALAGKATKKNAPESTPDPSVTAQNKVAAYANDATQPAPLLADYTALGITGVTASNLSAINSAVDALKSVQVDTKAKVQAVIDAYLKILAEANGGVVDATLTSNPTVSDYQTIGATIGSSATNTTALALLNDVIGGLTFNAVDSIAEINALAAVVDKVMSIAAGGERNLSVADLALLGFATSGAGAVNDANLAAITDAIAAAGGQGKVDTMAELTAVVTAVSTVMGYAEDGANAVPTVTMYTSWGITGVTAANLDAINSAIESRSGSQVDTKSKVQTIVNAYIKILAEANGIAADSTPSSNPTAGDYAAVGVQLGLAATQSNTLALLNDVIGGLTTVDIDAIAKINALAAAVEKVMQVAMGTGTGLSVAELSLLGLPTSGAGRVDTANLSAINNAIANAGGLSKVDSQAELSTLVVAVATIANYAADSTQAVPTLQHYSSAGITGVTAINLTSINSAVEANALGSIDTKIKLQNLVDTYILILAEANGAAADASPLVNPTAAQYAIIGADIGIAASNSINLTLLNDALAGLASNAVDTITEINSLASAANAVIGAAGGALAATQAELSLLGITGVNINNILAVQNAIAATADSGLQVDTMSELQAVVTAAVVACATSQNLIQNYASSNANPAPTVMDFSNIGVTGVSSSNLAAVNSALDALTSNTVNTPYLVQATVNAYSTILSEANGGLADATPGIDPTANDFAAIGASIGLAAGGLAHGTDLAASALALLDNAIGAMNMAAVDTVAEINAIASAVDKVMNLAKLDTGQAMPGGSITKADLILLGVDMTLADTSAELDAIWQAIIDSANTGSGVNTLQALQNIVNAHAS